jgi:glycosyltransferase involved in cell wall biosynthesis
VKICLVGLDNLPVLAPEFRSQAIGGESVQQTLLARALSRAGHEVSMVVADYGQTDGATWDGIRTFKACGFDQGLPILRFVHPRATGLWRALGRADADVYYTSCAGAHVGLIALFCQRQRRRFVFRTASDADCDPARLLVRYARDRWIYRKGLGAADAILVQSAAQRRALAERFGLEGSIAGMFVDRPDGARIEKDIDVLWVGNLRPLKRPDRLLDLARVLPWHSFHMVGGALTGESSCHSEIESAAAGIDNLVLHGRLPYADANRTCDRARLLVSTSDVEGFPNVFLQAWIRGVPVVSYLDPDNLIEREGLGIAVGSPADMRRAVSHLLADDAARAAAGERCRAFMDREFADSRILGAYLAAFERRPGGSAAGTAIAPATKVCNV